MDNPSRIVNPVEFDRFKGMRESIERDVVNRRNPPCVRVVVASQ
jgi:hypothetical protein